MSFEGSKYMDWQIEGKYFGSNTYSMVGTLAVFSYRSLENTYSSWLPSWSQQYVLKLHSQWQESRRVLFMCQQRGISSVFQKLRYYHISLVEEGTKR